MMSKNESSKLIHLWRVCKSFLFQCCFFLNQLWSNSKPVAWSVFCTLHLLKIGGQEEKSDFLQRKQSFSLKRKDKIFWTIFSCVQMNMSLWDVPRHLEDYNRVAAAEPRAFQELFQDTKLNQNDLTEKSVLLKYKIMENYQWWKKTCFMWTPHLLGHSFKSIFWKILEEGLSPSEFKSVEQVRGRKKNNCLRYSTFLATPNYFEDSCIPRSIL